MRRAERGAAAVWVAMLMPAFIVAVGLGVDLAGHAAAEQEVRSIAVEAARRGGQEFSLTTSDRAVLDGARARQAVQGHLRTSDLEGEVTVAANGVITVDAHGTYATVFLGVIGITKIDTQGTGTARMATVVAGEEH